MVRKLVKMGMCHLFGDYFFQSKYIAETKGENWYHLFIHCVLYSFPFIYFYGYKEQIMCIFISHFIIDSFKARYQKITYGQDQCLHYIVLVLIELINPL